MDDTERQLLKAIKTSRINHEFHDTTGSFSMVDVRRVIVGLEIENHALKTAIQETVQILKQNNDLLRKAIND